LKSVIAIGYIWPDADSWRHRGFAVRSTSYPGLAKDALNMTIEILYLTSQMQRWINLQVARHLEAQASKLKPAGGQVLLGADGPGGSVGLDRNGMPDCSEAVDETESIDTVRAAAGTRYPDAQMASRAGEKQTVRA
jgi:membrane protease subunit (stomatin/prohibitin family)